MEDCSAAFGIPCLPANSPAALTPAQLKLPLRPHQQRALHRCRVIEQDGSLCEDFKVGYGWTSGTVPYKSRGGVLTNAVGMGKTALAISLILTGEGDGQQQERQGQDCYYVLLCRTSLGYAARTRNGDNTLGGGPELEVRAAGLDALS